MEASRGWRFEVPASLANTSSFNVGFLCESRTLLLRQERVLSEREMEVRRSAFRFSGFRAAFHLLSSCLLLSSLELSDTKVYEP